MLAQLEHFPQRGNVLHTPSECRDVLNKLQWGGIVFHCNKADGAPYVIPDEMRRFRDGTHSGWNLGCMRGGCSSTPSRLAS